MQRGRSARPSLVTVNIWKILSIYVQIWWRPLGPGGGTVRRGGQQEKARLGLIISIRGQLRRGASTCTYSSAESGAREQFH
jgi:hypothetical protein